MLDIARVKFIIFFVLGVTLVGIVVRKLSGKNAERDKYLYCLLAIDGIAWAILYAYEMFN